MARKSVSKNDSVSVVTVGSATEDVFAKSDADTVTITHHGERETLIAYPVGTKILIEHVDFQVGGGGTNSATTFARQGLATGFLGVLGRDPSGRTVKSFLQKEGVLFLGVERGQTGYSVILDSEEEDRTILTFKGCNDSLTPTDVKNVDALSRARWLYASSMLGESAEALLAAMKIVKAHGGSVAFNPSSYQARAGLGTLQRFLDFVDVLVLNDEEAALLVDNVSTDVKELSRVLAAAGPSIVVVTRGAAGVLCFTGESFVTVKAREGVKVVETTGAGDAFGSAFIAGLARGFDTVKALRAGLCNAESVIASYGAKNHLLTKEELDDCLLKEARVVKEEKL